MPPKLYFKFMLLLKFKFILSDIFIGLSRYLKIWDNQICKYLLKIDKRARDNSCMDLGVNLSPLKKESMIIPTQPVQAAVNGSGRVIKKLTKKWYIIYYCNKAISNTSDLWYTRLSFFDLFGVSIVPHSSFLLY